MPFTVAALNAMITTSGVDTVSLHTGDPGSNGANEVSGGSYAQQAITFSTASGGGLDSSNAPVFDVPAGNTITHVGFWDGGTFKGGDPVTNEAFAADGTYTLSDADLSLS
jgi:hypothetical protein